MNELVDELIDAVMLELDDMINGYFSEYVGGSLDQFKEEMREDLKERIKDTLTAAARRGMISLRSNP